MVPRLPASVPRLGRRTTVTALPAAGLSLVVLGGVSGCRWGPEDTEKSGDNSGAPEPKGDAGIVERAASAIALNWMLVKGIAADQIGLAGAMEPLESMHAAHLELLNENGRDNDLEVDLPSGAKRAINRVLSQERELQRKLAKLAAEAESGDLARALASMSAGVNQGATVLATLDVGGAP